MATGIQPNRFNNLGIFLEGLEYIIDVGNQDLLAELFGKEEAVRILKEAHRSFYALPGSFSRYHEISCRTGNDILRYGLLEMRGIFAPARRTSLDLLLEMHVRYLRALFVSEST